ncbi:MAG: bifunctional pyr operon transcriptional regulator/uracil phosphoribosyltransferase PyrR [Gemmatimonadota bacterium]
MVGTVIMDAQAIDRALARIAHEIVEETGGADDLAIVGIQRRGAQLAERIVDEIERTEGRAPARGVMDITLYRDDLQTIADQAIVQKTEMPFKVEGKTIVLVDDVLYTGRTIRAALNEIMDFGRPRRVLLAVLVDRGHREIPIRAEFVGKNVPTSRSQQIKVKVEELDGVREVELVEREEAGL